MAFTDRNNNGKRNRGLYNKQEKAITAKNCFLRQRKINSVFQSYADFSSVPVQDYEIRYHLSFLYFLKTYICVVYFLLCIIVSK